MRLLFFQSRTERLYSVTSISCTLIACCAMLGAVMSLGGCGGGGDDTPQPSPSPSPTASPAPVPVRRTVTFDVAWATRTRGGFNVGAINSARSATFSFYENGVRTATPTAVVRVNRDPRNDAYTATYTTGGDTVDTQQPCLVDAVFYANPDQVGSVVAGVSARSAINPTTGVLVDTFTLTGEVTLVELSPATAFVGETSDVAVTTRNQFGVLLPISPGSITLTVEGTGTNILAVAPGTGPLDPLRVLGIRPGSATIVALVDGARSAPATVNVNSRATVSIAPPSPAVFLDREITLSATVSNLPASAGADGQRVLWSVLTPNGGTISPEGVYRAPTREGEFLVQAQSVFDPTKTATTVVRVTSGVQVQVSPANASVSWLESTPFTAQVLNAPAGQTDVNWSVEGGDANGTITAAGVYTAPKRDGTFTVIATSVFDNRRLGTATVTVSSQVEVTISPSTDVQVNVNATQQFTATVTRFVGDGSVTWSVEPDANGGPVGTINSSGVYTAPAQRRSVFIRATSNFDPTRFARVAVQVTAGGADVTVQ